MLCDVAEIHTGYGVMPRITHATGDEALGRFPDQQRSVIAYAKWRLRFPRQCAERIENKYWKI
jgi:hypothetical protein